MRRSRCMRSSAAMRYMNRFNTANVDERIKNARQQREMRQYMLDNPKAVRQIIASNPEYRRVWNEANRFDCR